MQSPLTELRQIFPDRSDSFLKRTVEDFKTVNASVDAILDGLVPPVIDQKRVEIIVCDSP